MSPISQQLSMLNKKAEEALAPEVVDAIIQEIDTVFANEDAARKHRKAVKAAKSAIPEFEETSRLLFSRSDGTPVGVYEVSSNSRKGHKVSPGVTVRKVLKRPE